MKIQSAKFVIAHKKKLYSVDMFVQDTDQNLRRAVVSVNDVPTGENLLNVSMSGRQLICQETAKTAIKQAIKSKG